MNVKHNNNSIMIFYGTNPYFFSCFIISQNHPTPPLLLMQKIFKMPEKMKEKKTIPICDELTVCFLVQKKIPVYFYLCQTLYNVHPAK